MCCPLKSLFVFVHCPIIFEINRRKQKKCQAFPMKHCQRSPPRCLIVT